MSFSPGVSSAARPSSTSYLVASRTNANTYLLPHATEIDVDGVYCENRACRYSFPNWKRYHPHEAPHFHDDARREITFGEAVTGDRVCEQCGTVQMHNSNAFSFDTPGCSGLNRFTDDFFEEVADAHRNESQEQKHQGAKLQGSMRRIDQALQQQQCPDILQQLGVDSDQAALRLVRRQLMNLCPVRWLLSDAARERDELPLESPSCSAVLGHLDLEKDRLSEYTDALRGHRERLRSRLKLAKMTDEQRATERHRLLVSMDRELYQDVLSYEDIPPEERAELVRYWVLEFKEQKKSIGLARSKAQRARADERQLSLACNAKLLALAVEVSTDRYPSTTELKNKFLQYSRLEKAVRVVDDGPAARLRYCNAIQPLIIHVLTDVRNTPIGCLYGVSNLTREILSDKSAVAAATQTISSDDLWVQSALNICWQQHQLEEQRLRWASASSKKHGAVHLHSSRQRIQCMNAIIVSSWSTETPLAWGWLQSYLQALDPGVPKRELLDQDLELFVRELNLVSFRNWSQLVVRFVHSILRMLGQFAVACESQVLAVAERCQREFAQPTRVIHSHATAVHKREQAWQRHSLKRKREAEAPQRALDKRILEFFKKQKVASSSSSASSSFDDLNNNTDAEEEEVDGIDCDASVASLSYSTLSESTLSNKGRNIRDFAPNAVAAACINFVLRSKSFTKQQLLSEPTLTISRFRIKCYKPPEYRARPRQVPTGGRQNAYFFKSDAVARVAGVDQDQMTACISLISKL
jgi:hypothetical protein